MSHIWKCSFSRMAQLELQPSVSILYFPCSCYLSLDFRGSDWTANRKWIRLRGVGAMNNRNQRWRRGEKCRRGEGLNLLQHWHRARTKFIKIYIADVVSIHEWRRVPHKVTGLQVAPQERCLSDPILKGDTRPSFQTCNEEKKAIVTSMACNKRRRQTKIGNNRLFLLVLHLRSGKTLQIAISLKLFVF